MFGLKWSDFALCACVCVLHVCLCVCTCVCVCVLICTQVLLDATSANVFSAKLHYHAAVFEMSLVSMRCASTCIRM